MNVTQVDEHYSLLSQIYKNDAECNLVSVGSRNSLIEASLQFRVYGLNPLLHLIRKHLEVACILVTSLIYNKGKSLTPSLVGPMIP